MKQEKEELTGLYTVETAKEMAMQYLQESEESVVLVVVDIDDFIRVNESFGREKGDEILLDTSYILQQSFLEDDIICRADADEFIVFLKDCQESMNLNIRLYELCTALEREVTDGLNDCLITASIGVATSKSLGRDFERLYCCAKDAMKRVKNSGKDAVKFFHGKGDGNEELCSEEGA